MCRIDAHNRIILCVYDEEIGQRFAHVMLLLPIVIVVGLNQGLQDRIGNSNTGIGY